MKNVHNRLASNRNPVVILTPEITCVFDSSLLWRCWVWVGTEAQYWEEPLLYYNLPLDKISVIFFLLLLLFLVTHILFLHISVLESVKQTFINSLRAESRTMFSVSCSQWQQFCADDPVTRKPCYSKPACPHPARHQGVCSSLCL